MKTIDKILKFRKKLKAIPLWAIYAITTGVITISTIGIGFGIKNYIEVTQLKTQYKRRSTRSSDPDTINQIALAKDGSTYAPWQGKLNISTNNVEDLQCYFETGNGEFLGDYEYEANHTLVDRKVVYDLNSRGYRIVTKSNIIRADNNQKEDADEFILHYGQVQKKVVKMKCDGPTIFINEYTEIINAKQWYEFVQWFLTNVSWGPEIYDLEEFRVSRGYKEDSPGVITLGGYTNPNKEKPAITFYPDGFYGYSPMYSTWNASWSSSLTVKFQDPGGRTKFTKTELNTILKDSFSKMAKETQEEGETKPRFNPFLIVETGLFNKMTNAEGKVVSEPLYEVYFERYGGLIERVGKRYPYLFSAVDKTLNYIWDDSKKEFNLVEKSNAKCKAAKFEKKPQSVIDYECDIKVISIDRGLSSALIMKTLSPDYEFNNVFLKYTAMHEYYHHGTLTYSKNLAKDYAYVGAFDSNSGPTVDSAMNLESLNEYFSNRNPVVRAKRNAAREIRFDLDKGTNGNPQWEAETLEDIFGEAKNAYNSETQTYRLGISDKDDIYGRSYRSWGDLAKLINEPQGDKNYPNSQYIVSIFTRNAFDNYSGTLSPSVIDENDKLYVLDENDNFVRAANTNLNSLQNFYVPKNYEIRGFDAERKYVRALNSYPATGLFQAFQDDFNRFPEYDYINKWLYMTLTPEQTQVTSDKNSDFDLLTGPYEIETYSHVAKASRELFFKFQKRDGTMKRFYINRAAYFGNEKYSNVPWNFNMMLGFWLATETFDGFPLKKINWTLLLSSITHLNQQYIMLYTRNAFDNIKKFPIKGEESITVSYNDGTQEVVQGWSHMGNFLETISKKGFNLGPEDSPSLANVNSEVIDKSLLESQLIAMTNAAQAKADALVKGDGESDEAFNTRKQQIITKGEKEKQNYLNFLNTLFSFISEDFQIAEDLIVTNDDGTTTIIPNGKLTTEGERVSNFHPSYKEALEKLKKAFGEYPKYLSQIDYYLRQYKITIPKDDSTNIWDVPISDTNDISSDSLYIPPLKVSIGSISDEIDEIKDSNHLVSLGSLFANYTLTFEEVLVRDYLLSTYVPSRQQLIPEKFARSSGLADKDISEASSGNTIYIPEEVYNELYHDVPILNDDGTPILNDDGTPKTTRRLIVNETDLVEEAKIEFGNYYHDIIDGVVTQKIVDEMKEMITRDISDDKFFDYVIENIAEKHNYQGATSLVKIPFEDKIVEGIKNIQDLTIDSLKIMLKNKIDETLSKVNSVVSILSSILESTNDGVTSVFDSARGVFAKDGFQRSQGFFSDKWIKENLGWQLYNEDRSPAQYGALEYWNYIKEINDMGETWITNIQRKKSTDTIHMHGYLPNDKVDKVKYLVFESLDGNGIKKLNVYTGVDNLHVLQKQVDPSSAKTIRDEGYTGWVSDSIVVGNYRNAVLPVGKYNVYFETKNGERLDLEFNRDASEYKDANESVYTITENGKQVAIAPCVFTYDKSRSQGKKFQLEVKGKFGG